MRIIGHQRLLLQETWQHEYKQLKNITIVADLKSISLFPRALIVAFLFHNNDLYCIAQVKLLRLGGVCVYVLVTQSCPTLQPHGL